MRQKIKEIAAALLITHGYRGLRFGDIAERLGTTRANVHYHFGTKKNLVEEVIEDYLGDTIEQMSAIWTDDDISYQEKALRTMAFNRRRYGRFNPKGAGGKPWSLISRMRLEADLLSDRAKASLRRFSEQMDSLVNSAVALAQRNGEIAPDAPAKDVAVQLVSIIDSAGSITQDAGSFDRLEHLYLAHMRVVAHAYGGKKRVAPRADSDKAKAGARSARSGYATPARR